jgi:hypothetical protein
MKALTRIGIFILAIAVTLFLTSTLRAYSQVAFGIRGNIEPNEWIEMGSHSLLSPQTLKISFGTSNATPIDIYILNQQQLQTWKTTNTLNPTIKIENQSSLINTYEIPTRDFYTILAYNPNTQTEGIQIILTLYGFEKDLLLTITALTVTGIILITLPKLKKSQHQPT